MLYALLITIHIIACLILIAVILLQAGRGGGLNESFGGEAQSILGTQAPIILKKATSISAITFLATSLVLGAVTARRGKSLLDQFNSRVLPVSPVQKTVPQAAPMAPEVSETATDETAKSAETVTTAAPAATAPVAVPAAQEASPKAE